MSASERRKGAVAEREVASIFAAAGFSAYRTPNSGGLRVKGDLLGTPLHLEIKRQETLRLPTWLRQAQTDAAGQSYAVVFRQSRGEWFATMPLAQLVASLSLAADQERALARERRRTLPS